mgnify:FL=1
MDDDLFGHEPDGELAEPDPLLPSQLMAIDDVPAAPVDPPAAESVPHRYRRSMGATMLAASMIGLRDILENPRDDRPVVEQHVDEGDVDRPIDVVLDPDDPSASVVRIRRES